MDSLRFHRLAAQEYRFALDWYRKRDAAVAARFRDAVDAAANRILNDPDSHLEIIDGIRSPARFNATVGTEDEARRLVSMALPHAIELSPAIPGKAYSTPPQGQKAWYQVHPPEPSVGNHLPHVKYADWTKGKKGRGGSWGHLYFDPVVRESESSPKETDDVIHV